MDEGDPGGGSLQLAKLIDEFGEHLLSDFYRYYNRDLGDVLVPGSRLTPNACIALIRNLPDESATVAAMRGGSQFRGWGTDRYLLALLVDSIQENTWAFVAANSKKKPKRPEPLPRPGKSSAPKKNQFAALARAAYKGNSGN